MLRTKIFDALKEFIPDMDDGCFERGCPAIDHFSSHTTTQDDELKEMVEKGTKAWADIPDDWVDDLRGGIESCTKVGTKSGVLRKDWAKWQPLYAAPVHASDMSEEHVHKSDKDTLIKQAEEAFESAKEKGWVGLTDEDIDLYAFDIGVTDNKAPAWLVTYARGIEAKLKEKNNE
jgi:hypothetical protein